ncbi:hypothetical protein NDN08_002839 [Rhodosorus marinus]|uniref:Plectin/eS10 N-terminal domain-containing protein n=1 Tax=Rhodosorus marinus TaxID=101924 RepID=A0A7S2ZAK4_9RHOD|nr:hypothetical protein NDN08_002839 [Rhodosorus marinus]|mmetsp:Transcript_12108/g.50298  ORF Transcript_12108/g.50298 Transcript_12108/m.50298 type:complete len:161 (+) Transcript_12108:135-617(+)
MLLPKKTRVEVYKQLFKDGVMVAPKDYNLPSHKDVDVPNLHVLKLMQSLKSRGYVKEVFSWQYFYYFLTEDGIQYLQGYLNYPDNVKPDTTKKQTQQRPGPQRGGPGGGFGGGFGEKKMGPGGDFRPEYREGGGRGFGRGAEGSGGYRSAPSGTEAPAPM